MHFLWNTHSYWSFLIKPLAYRKCSFFFSILLINFLDPGIIAEKYLMEIERRRKQFSEMGQYDIHGICTIAGEIFGHNCPALTTGTRRHFCSMGEIGVLVFPRCKMSGSVESMMRSSHV